MSRDTRLRILCYDISDNKRRRRVARLLEDKASRVQFSVFETRLNDKTLVRLISKVAPLLGKGDSLRVYTVGATGERRCEVHGSGIPIENDANYWLL